MRSGASTNDEICNCKDKKLLICSLTPVHERLHDLPSCDGKGMHPLQTLLYPHLSAAIDVKHISKNVGARWMYCISHNAKMGIEVLAWVLDVTRFKKQGPGSSSATTPHLVGFSTIFCWIVRQDTMSLAYLITTNKTHTDGIRKTNHVKVNVSCVSFGSGSLPCPLEPVPSFSQGKTV